MRIPGEHLALRDVDWILHTPAGVERPDLTAEITLYEKPDGTAWSVRAISGGIDLDSDDVADISIDRPDQWRIHIRAAKAWGTFDLSRADLSPHRYSTVQLIVVWGERVLFPRHGSTVIGPNNGADLVVTGSHFRDVITTGRGDDLINAQGGNDIVITGPGHDKVVGGGGSDVITTGVGHDHVIGDYRAMRPLAGHPFGDDVIRTGAGSSLVEVHGGADIIRGGPGTDIVSLNGATAADVRLGDGRDFIDMSGATARRVDCGRGNFDVVETSLRQPRPRGLRGCERIGHFRLLEHFMFPVAHSTESDDVATWPCGRRHLCPVRRY